MKVIIVNGSPRKNGNTINLIKSFQSGLLSVLPESQIKQFNLNELTFKGCQSCFACKLKNGKTYGVCTIKDDLLHVLDEISDTDCLVVASPIYLMDVTSSVKAFLERLCFSLGSYEKGYKSLAKNSPYVVTLYTMNTTQQYQPECAMENIDMFLGHIFTKPYRVCAYNTYQFSDYSKYNVEVFDENDKLNYRENILPKELEASFNLGSQIANRYIYQKQID